MVIKPEGGYALQRSTSWCDDTLLIRILFVGEGAPAEHHLEGTGCYGRFELEIESNCESSHVEELSK